MCECSLPVLPVLFITDDKMTGHASDVLGVIPKSDITNFCENVLATELPDSLQAYYFIKTCSLWKEQNPKFDVTFLYYKNNTKSGIFVGLLKTGSRTITMVIYALENNEKLLSKVLKESALIPWDSMPLIRCSLKKHIPILKEVISSKGLAAILQPECHLYTVPIDVATSYEISIPPEVYVEPLKPDNIKTIYDTWPLHYVYTYEMLKFAIELSYSYGVYSKENDSLLAWVIQFDYGGIGQLQNRENEERAGYGKLLCKLLSQKLANMGIQPFAFARDINASSKSVFEAAGFSPICPVTSIIVSRN